MAYTLDNWRTCWETSDIPWAGEKVNDDFFLAFQKVLEVVGKPASEIRAFIPLCGNSPAVRFLYDKGMSVTGLDFVQHAIDQLCAEQFSGLNFNRSSRDGGGAYVADRITLLVNDIFRFSGDQQFDLVYDRGAFVAISPDKQAQYAAAISAALRPGGIIFLRCAEFIGAEFKGPPFSVGSQTVRDKFSGLEVVEEEMQTVEPSQDRYIQAGVKQIAFRNFILRRP